MQAAARIMVVDDEARICDNVEKILSKNNYEVTRASSADEALEKMSRESFNLLISDIVMPGRNGLELLKDVKAQWPLTKAVMMTAYASTDTAIKAVRLGALDYIPKPFTPDELRRTVDDALKGELIEAATTADVVWWIKRSNKKNSHENASFTGEAGGLHWLATGIARDGYGCLTPHSCVGQESEIASLHPARSGDGYLRTRTRQT